MNNNFDKFNFPNIFDLHIPHSSTNFSLSETKQQTFDFRKPSSSTFTQENKLNFNVTQQDKRTEDQVMSNLSFSIEDLLSKISKVRQQCEVPVQNIISKPKVIQKPYRKQQSLNFKISNLSASTQTNSNKSKSDQYIQKFETQLWTNKTRGSQPNMEIMYNSQKNVKIVLPQSQNKRKENQNQRVRQGYISQSKKQIKNILSPFQTSQISAFGKSNHFPIRTQKKSIIIEDDVKKTQSNYQQLKISNESKINSLFTGKNIREVAASTIMDSPQKVMKKNAFKMQNPFLDIVGKTDSIIQQKNLINHQYIQKSPLIKINGIAKSNFLKQEQKSMKQAPKLTVGDFILGRQLGSGKFGDVYQAIHKKTGTLYAIKKIFKSTILQYNMIQQFTRQLKIHYMLDYPNIVKLYTHFDDQYHIFLVMQYGQGGMLMEKLKNGQKFSSIIIQQMLRGVDYLQSKKIAHRDIKPENIVLMFGDTAKLCDFGWSRIFDSEMKKTFCGTLDYVSPQMKDNGQYSIKIDIWSLGVLTFEIICGYAPFKNQITNWKVKGGNLNNKWNWNILYPPEVSSVAESFMRNLLKQNPNERANIRFCMNHLFIRKYNQMSFDSQQEKRFQQISLVLEN